MHVGLSNCRFQLMRDRTESRKTRFGPSWTKDTHEPYSLDDGLAHHAHAGDPVRRQRYGAAQLGTVRTTSSLGTGEEHRRCLRATGTAARNGRVVDASGRTTRSAIHGRRLDRAANCRGVSAERQSSGRDESHADDVLPQRSVDRRRHAFTFGSTLALRPTLAFRTAEPFGSADASGCVGLAERRHALRHDPGDGPRARRRDGAVRFGRSVDRTSYPSRVVAHSRRHFARTGRHGS